MNYKKTLSEFLAKIKYDQYEQEIAAIIDNKEKGNIFEYLCYYILKYHPFYIHEFAKDEIYLWNDIPQSIKDDLKLPEKDKGIDILAKKQNGEFCAIQCKFRSNKDAIIPWAEVSTFYGLKDICNIKYSIFMTNCYDVNKELESKISDHLVVCCGEFWDTITPTFLSEIFYIINNNKQPKPIELTPKPHQQDCLNKFRTFIEENKSKRGKIIMPCGTGKTLQTYFISKQHDFKEIAIIVPSLHLLSQYYLEYSRFGSDNYNYLLIGSDADTEIKHVHGPIITTNYDDIKNWITKNKNKVIFSTYQSSALLKKALIECDNTLDICYYDEAHKTIGEKDKMFTSLLEDDFKTKYKIFLTATPKYYIGGMENMKKLSMSNYDIYGEEIYSMKLREAINNKLLCNYQLITPVCNNEMLTGFIDKNKIVIDEKLNFGANYSIFMASAIILIKSIEKYPEVRKILTYHNTIKESQEFKKLLIILAKIFNIEVYINYIDGSYSMGKRMKIFDEFKRSKIGIICSARTMNEGVNLPFVDCVSFISNRKSIIDVIQCIGRCMRLYENKEISSIIIPLFGTQQDHFENLYNLIKAIKTQDSNIVEYFREKKNNGLSGKLIIRNDNIIEVDILEKINTHTWIKDIELKINDLIDIWVIKYNKLKEYVEKNNKLPSQSDKDKNFIFLCDWIGTQRKNYRKKSLSEERISQLEQIEGWFWNINNEFEKDWNENLNNLKKYINENNKLPSYSDKDKNIKSLASWIKNQRTNYKKNDLSEQRIKQLEQINGWYWDELEKEWTEKLNNIQKYVNENNKLPPFNNKDKNIKSLALWIGTQRSNYKKNSLSEQRIKQLEQINGWYWDGCDELEKEWTEKLNNIQKYVNENNNLPPQSDKDKNIKLLASWIGKQRKNYKKNDLSEQRIKQLEQINGWYWDGYDELEKEWTEKLNNLKKYVEENNKLPPYSDKDKNIKSLGQWTGRQRANYKKNDLSEQRIKQLEQINGWYWGVDEIWVENLNKLKKYVDENNKLPPFNNKDKNIKSFAIWISNQRADYKKNVLSEEKIKQLEQINGWYWNVDGEFEKEWIESLNNLKKYIEENNKLPPQHDKDKNINSLASWIGKQRKNYKKNDLSEEKIKQLEQINSWYWDGNNEIEKEWTEKLNNLKKYVEENNNLPSFNDTDKNIKSLAKWISQQRINYKQKKLSDEKIKQLDQINGWFWNVDSEFEKEWIEKLNNLKKYVEENNKLPHFNDKHKNIKSLAMWIGTQRRNYKKNGLSEEKIKQLEQINGWYWDENDEFEKEWIEKLNNLKKYVEENNKLPHFNDKHKNIKSLAMWIGTQRKNYKKNLISEEKIHKLEAITHWYWSK